jgi:hypothetical protein
MQNRREILPGNRAKNKSRTGAKKGQNCMFYFSSISFAGQQKTPSPKYGIDFAGNSRLGLITLESTPVSFIRVNIRVLLPAADER